MANATITITGQVTDSAGLVFTFSTTAVQDSFTATASVSPQTAPPGTTRTWTYSPPVGGIGPFTYATPVAAGITFTPVAGQPTQWTFVY